LVSPRSQVVFAAALAVLAVLVWFAFGRGDGPADIERRGAPRSTAVDDVDAGPPAAATDLANASPEQLAALAPVGAQDVRSSLERHVPGGLDGLRFDDLLRPRIEGSDAPLLDFEVVAIASDGTRREAASHEPVLTRDLAIGGVLVVSATGACPRFVDAAWLAARRGFEDGLPVDLPLAAAATLVVHVAEPPAGRRRPDTFLLAPTEPFFGAAVLRSGDPSTRAPFASHEERLAALRRLAASTASDPSAASTESTEPAATPERARADLALARSDPAWSAILEPAADPAAGPTTRTFATPWLARHLQGADTGRVVFDLVPANTPVVLYVPWHLPLRLDAHAALFAAIDAAFGRLATEALVLAPGQVLELAVGHEELAGFTGRLPAGAGAPWYVAHSLSIRSERRNASGSATAGLPIVPIAENGVFERRDLVPGSHTIEAHWTESGGVTRIARRTFDLAPGEFEDLGELAVEGAGTLTIDTRLVPDGAGESLPSGRALDTIDLVAAVRHENAQNGPTLARATLRHGNTTVIDRLTPGRYVVVVNGTQRHERPSRADAPEGLDEKYLEDWLARAVLPEPGIALVDAPLVVPVELAPDGRLELVVRVAETGVCNLDVTVEPHLCIPNLRVCAWFVRGDGADMHFEQGFAWEGLPGSRGHATSSTTLPVGAWTVVTLLELPGDAAVAPLHHVALDRIVVTGSEPVDLRPVLEPSAALRFQGHASRDLRDAEFPHWHVGTAREFHVEQSLVVTGLLPGREMLLPSGQSVRTGPAGSTVDAP